MIAAAIVAIGFVCTLLTGNEFYTYTGGAIGLVVLVYCYPTKKSWIRTVQRFTESPDISGNSPSSTEKDS
jgi:hypothetical protein